MPNYSITKKSKGVTVYLGKNKNENIKKKFICVLGGFFGLQEKYKCPIRTSLRPKKLVYMYLFLTLDTLGGYGQNTSSRYCPLKEILEILIPIIYSIFSYNLCNLMYIRYFVQAFSLH